MLRLLFYFLACVIACLSVNDVPPPAGWCKTPHYPKKAAQSGQKGYCALCFKKKFPKEYAERNEKRKQTSRQCVICLERKSELYSKKFCRSCYRARCCERCAEVNMDKKAKACLPCSQSRKAMHAKAERLALWCGRCYEPHELAAGVCGHCLEAGTEECVSCKKQDYLVEDVCHGPSDCKRQLRLCRACYSVPPSSQPMICAFCQKKKLVKCDQCGSNDHLVDDKFICQTSTCSARLRFCESCVSVATRAPKVLCKSCWIVSGKMCVCCSSAPARYTRESLRFCYNCVVNFYCPQCKAPPSGVVTQSLCRVCTRTALWCRQHCSATELEASLCRQHYDSCYSTCAYCQSSTDGVASSWHSCSFDGCRFEVHLCDACTSRASPIGAICYSCWVHHDRKCLLCNLVPAHSVNLHRCCRSCFSTHFKDEEDRLVHLESQSYLAIMIYCM